MTVGFSGDVNTSAGSALAANSALLSPASRPWVAKCRRGPCLACPRPPITPARLRCAGAIDDLHPQSISPL